MIRRTVFEKPSEALGLVGPEKSRADSELLGLVLKASKPGFILFKDSGQQIWRNENVSSIFQQADETPELFDLFHDPLLSLIGVSQAAAKAISENSPNTISWIGEAGENRQLDLMIEITPVLFNGSPHILLTIEDQEDLHKKQAELLEPITSYAETLDGLRMELGRITDTVQVGLLRTKMHKMVWVNPAFAEMLGYQQSEMENQPTRMLYPTDQTLEKAGAEIRSQIFSGSESFVFDTDFLHKDGSIRRVEVRGSVVSIPTIESIFAIRDVTQERATSQQLREALNQAQAASESKSVFLRTISHELRTPLNGIMGTLQALNWMGLNAKAQSAVAVAQDASKHLLAVLNDILDYARTSAGHLALNPQPRNLLQILQSIQDLLQQTPTKDQLKLEAHFGAELDVTVMVDDVRLRQVLLNLINNALKFTSIGCVIFRANRLPGPDDELLLEVSVEDTGIGMDEETLARLYQPFMQADQRPNRAFTGTGLGLVIVKSLLEAMAGRIDVQSQLGVGTRFTITLPLPITHTSATTAELQDIQSAAATFPLNQLLAQHGAAMSTSAVPEATQGHSVDISPGHEAPSGDRSLAGRRIAVIDDQGVNRMVLRTMLLRAGAQPAEFATGDAFLSALDEPNAQYDLALVDLHMAPMDGWTLCQRCLLHETPRWRGLPMIAVSGNVREVDIDRALAVGMQGFVSKPVLYETLIEEILRCLDAEPRAAS